MRAKIIIFSAAFLVSFNSFGDARLPANAAGTVSPYDEAIAAYQAKTRIKIVGGKIASIKDHPWQVSLQVARIPEIEWAHFCGGSIISPTWVLTAAHCVPGRTPTDLTVSVGTDNLDAKTVRAKVRRIISHPSYNPQTMDNDIALIELDAPVTLSTTVQPIKLARSTEVESLLGQQANSTVTGWGATSEGGQTVRDLRYVNVPLVDRKVCNRPLAYDGAITANMLCAGKNGGGTDSCQGDSGGPLSARFNGASLLIGAVSWGEGCGRPNKFGVYTHLANYISWVEGYLVPKN